MSDYHVLIGIVTVLFGLVGYGFYFWSIWYGETRPHLFTWLTFLLLDATVFWAQWLHGAGPGSWALLLSAVENTLVCVFALKWGEKRITATDTVSFAAALCGIALWWLTSDALAAVVIAAGVNALAYIPTFRKTYVRPRSESLVLWTLDLFRFGLSLVALEAFNLVNALLPATIVLGNAALIAMVLIRRRRVARADALR